VPTTDAIMNGYYSWPHSHSFWSSLCRYWGQMGSLFKCEKTKDEFNTRKTNFINM